LFVSRSDKKNPVPASLVGFVVGLRIHVWPAVYINISSHLECKIGKEIA
jgi:hypothetical protein